MADISETYELKVVTVWCHSAVDIGPASSSHFVSGKYVKNCLKDEIQIYILCKSDEASFNILDTENIKDFRRNFKT